MSVIDKAKQHFSGQEITKIAVPEWGDENEPLYIYSKPL